MPQPVYTLCCQAGSEDKYTGLISHFNVIERIIVSKIEVSKIDAETVAPVNTTVHQIRLVSVWMRTAQDSDDDDFEYMIEIVMPPSGRRSKVQEGRFKFTKPLHRFTFNFIGSPPLEGSGIMWMECKVRKLGEELWLTQAYPIFFESNLGSSS
jgi:hypothetical protein